MDSSNQISPPPGAPARKDWRDRLRLPLMLSAPVLLLAIAGYFYLGAGRIESTDDAYVQTARVAISADVAGRVKDIAVHDNQRVHKGQVLYRLDDAPFRIALAQAAAQRAGAQLKIEMLKANYRQLQATLAAAQNTLKFQQTEYQRQQRLSQAQIASQAQLDQAAHALSDAQAQRDAVQQQISAVVANLAGNPGIAPAQHPEVRQAQAQLDMAQLNLGYTVIRAPVDGIVTRVEGLQVGNYIAASAPVFALVPAGDTWIEANFKEDQLAHMHSGQRAEVTIDSYPGKVFSGRVVSVSPETGSQASVLPAENATGNWVKVVQRLPVRIALAHADQALALAGGLSVSVSVDTGFQRHVFGADSEPAGSRP
jgi:membrane fusion protein (multidrug efflux system)